MDKNTDRDRHRGGGHISKKRSPSPQGWSKLKVPSLHSSSPTVPHSRGSFVLNKQLPQWNSPSFPMIQIELKQYIFFSNYKVIGPWAYLSHPYSLFSLLSQMLAPSSEIKCKFAKQVASRSFHSSGVHMCRPTCTHTYPRMPQTTFYPMSNIIFWNLNGHPRLRLTFPIPSTGPRRMWHCAFGLWLGMEQQGRHRSCPKNTPKSNASLV